mmetsp:Transcript_48610/g.80913  ORF Transcript_48610/g.80913 Transcript_48610/m.80913 type:complete len:709 (+) Transcript_48610:49-2175(+)
MGTRASSHEEQGSCEASSRVVGFRGLKCIMKRNSRSRSISCNPSRRLLHASLPIDLSTISMPSELWALIFSKLSARDLILSVVKVSKEWRSIALSREVWTIVPLSPLISPKSNIPVTDDDSISSSTLKVPCLSVKALCDDLRLEDTTCITNVDLRPFYLRDVSQVPRLIRLFPALQHVSLYLSTPLDLLWLNDFAKCVCSTLTSLELIFPPNLPGLLEPSSIEATHSTSFKRALALLSKVTHLSIQGPTFTRVISNTSWRVSLPCKVIRLDVGAALFYRLFIALRFPFLEHLELIQGAEKGSTQELLIKLEFEMLLAHLVSLKTLVVKGPSPIPLCLLPSLCERLSLLSASLYFPRPSSVTISESERLDTLKLSIEGSADLGIYRCECLRYLHLTLTGKSSVLRLAILSCEKLSSIIVTGGACRLALDDCPALTELSLPGYTHELLEVIPPTLRHLSLGTTHLTDDHSDRPNSLFFSSMIGRCTTLTTLKLHNIHFRRNRWVIASNTIDSISYSNCSFASKTSLQIFCPSLSTLHMSLSILDGPKTFDISSSHLKDLALSGTSFVTDRWLTALFQKSSSSLQFLKIEHCPYLTMLPLSCRVLRHVTVTNCCKLRKVTTHEPLLTENNSSLPNSKSELRRTSSLNSQCPELRIVKILGTRHSEIFVQIGGQCLHSVDLRESLFIGLVVCPSVCVLSGDDVSNVVRQTLK